MRIVGLLTAVIALLFFTSPAPATVWYVHPDSPFNCIQLCLDSCATGDTVLVGPGIYYENIVWPTIQGINLISEMGADTTVIDGKIVMENTEVLSLDAQEVMDLARVEAQKAIDLIDLEEFRPSDKVFWHGSRYEEV